MDSKITNKQLIEILSKMDEDMPVLIKDKDDNLFPLSIVIEHDVEDKYQIELCVNEFLTESKPMILTEDTAIYAKRGGGMSFSLHKEALENVLKGE